MWKEFLSRQSFKFAGGSTKIIAYKLLARSMLEYAKTIWNSYISKVLIGLYWFINLQLALFARSMIDALSYCN